MTNIFQRFSNGMSLIEIAIGIIFMGVAFTATLFSIRAIESESHLMTALMEGTAFGNSIMEVIRSHRYDENLSAPWTLPVASEGGDTDDIDDYCNGYDWTYAEYNGYTAKSRVFYVDPNVNLIDSVASRQNYKRIVIHVYHAAFDEKLTIDSVVTP